MTYKTLISDTRLPQGNESINLNLKQPTRARRPLLRPSTASVASLIVRLEVVKHRTTDQNIAPDLGLLI